MPLSLMLPKSHRILLRVSVVFVAITSGWIAMAQEANIAIGSPVSASAATYGGQVPENLTDANLSNQSHPLASSGTLGFYYEIDLGATRNLGRVELVNRSGCCPERLSNYRVEIRADAGGAAGAVNWSAAIRTDGSDCGDGGRDVVGAGLDPGGSMSGRYIRVVNLSDAAYNPQIAEVEAYEAPFPIISFFNTDHGNITAIGNPNLPASATLSWAVSGAESVVLDNGVGTVAAAGQLAVSPAVTTTYVLTANNSSGSSAKAVTVGVDQPVIAPVLNEFMADNTSTLDDQAGANPDWIEIYNPNGFELSLDGYYLTDDAADLTKWRIPAANAPANGYLVVFASGDNLTDPREPLHTNFQLSKAGEYLALVDPDGTSVLGQFPIDHPATATYPLQKEDVSYGLEPGGATAGFFVPPTPGAANSGSFAGFVADTKFSVGRGFYTAAVDVAITTTTPGAVVRFTTDGSEPTVSHGTIYTTPVHIADTTVLRASAYKSGLAPTNVDTNTYVFVDDVIASPDLGVAVTQQMRDSLTAVPSMSIVTPSAINATSEVPTSCELIFPDGSIGFQENCGVKNFGGAFTNFEKKSFRLYFRSQYGASKLKFPLFDGFDHGVAAAESFDQLNLRSGSHDMNQRGFYMSNRFSDDSMLDMGNINPHGRFMHLYINGRYWGVYHLRERWSASTLTEYLGGPKSGYEAINGNWNVGGWADSVISAYDGDGSAWARIKSLATDYEGVRPYLDVPHFIDYMIMWMFGDSEDEYRCTGPADVGSGFKWFLNDADGYLRTSAGNRTGFASNTPGVFGRSAGDGPGSLFSLLFKAGNPDYRTLLADRIHKHYFNDGAMTPAKTIPRLNGRCDEIDLPFYAEAQRWNYRTHASWASSKDSILNSWLPGRTATVIGQFRSAGFYPSTDAPAFSQHGGDVPDGFNLTMTGGSGTMYYTTDGSDPRLPGGAVSPSAEIFQGGQVASTAIPAGATWRYLDDGSDQGAAWRAAAFDDGAWASGPAELGYGEGDEATVVSWGANSSLKFTTTYLRHAFQVADAGSLLGAEVLIKRDDGAVVYLNGTEVGRSSMPSGTVNYQTFATSASDDGSGFHPLSVPASLFQNGSNVIAVELHQSTLNSSDLSFDLELRLTRPADGASALNLTAHALVRARALDGGTWSALNEAFYTVGGSAPVAPGEVVISEIHYNPPGADDSEFLELFNPSSHAINLRGAYFSDGIKFAFPDNRDIPLPPGGRVLLVASQYGIDQAYGIGLPIAGVYRGNLDNGGETLTLVAEDGITVLFSTTFDGADPWPEEADGGGHSLVLADLSAPDSVVSWRPSSDIGGSPGLGEGTTFSGDPDADNDGDGASAFAEYAMGTSDQVAGDASGLPTIATDPSGNWVLSFALALGADDVRAVLEYSTDLSTWEENPAAAEFTRSELRGTRMLRTFSSSTPIGAARQFVRVRYEKL